MSRDPRIDPQTGDVVRSGIVLTSRVVIRVEYGRVVWSRITGRACFGVSLNGWRRWAKNGDALKRAGESDGNS